MDLGPRRYSNNHLQKPSSANIAARSAARHHAGHHAGAGSVGSITPRASDGSPSAAGSPSADSSDGSQEEYESWINNIRVIEYIRNCVKERLERGDFESDGEPMDLDRPAGSRQVPEPESRHYQQQPAKPLYPALRGMP